MSDEPCQARCIRLPDRDPDPRDGLTYVQAQSRDRQRGARARCVFAQCSDCVWSRSWAQVLDDFARAQRRKQNEAIAYLREVAS